jgi:hypothetical protein
MCKTRDCFVNTTSELLRETPFLATKDKKERKKEKADSSHCVTNSNRLRLGTIFSF